jgi:pimeloyl-ACP methyl ester carboxylesterase
MVAAASPPELGNHRFVYTNGVRLHCVEAGDGPPVILLHGFPEFWYSWRHQLPALAAAGFRAVAPDLRGYNDSDKPPGVESYRPELLAQDVVGLIEKFGPGPAVLVGHDWGGIIAWLVTMRRPDLVQKLVVMNAPHPATFVAEVRHARQFWRSWYAFFFQLPWFPEAALRFQNFGMVRHALRRQPVHAAAFRPEDIRRYREALAKPAAVTAAINYYRAAFRYRRETARTYRPIRGPVLVIWGEKDSYLNPHVLDGLPAWAPDARLLRLPDASHWVQNDAPDAVNQALLSFLSQTWVAG